MTEEEKQKFLAVYERQQAGYRYMQQERDRDLKNVDTVIAVQQLGSAFDMATKLPLRESSGLIEFYKALSKTR